MLMKVFYRKEKPTTDDVCYEGILDTNAILSGESTLTDCPHGPWTDLTLRLPNGETTTVCVHGEPSQFLPKTQTEDHVPPMLLFSLVTDDYHARSQQVYVDPQEVISVREDSYRPAYGGSRPTAIIVMTTGEHYRVEDGSRNVAKKIMAAKERHQPE